MGNMLEKTEKTRKLLIECAIKRFSKEGFAATKLEDIASDAGFTRGAFYWHFKNKFAIFKFIVEENRHETLKDVANYLETDDNPAERIRGFIQYLVRDRHRKYHQVFALLRLKQEAPRAMDELENQLPSVQEIVIPSLESTIEEGKKIGVFGKDIDAQFTARYIFTFFCGFFPYYQDIYSDYTDDQLYLHVDLSLRRLLGIKLI